MILTKVADCNFRNWINILFLFFLNLTYCFLRVCLRSSHVSLQIKMYVVYLSGRELKQLEGAPLQTMIRADTY